MRLPESEYAKFLSERRSEILGRVFEAARRAGRSEDEICVQAVSKTASTEEALIAFEVGWDLFGENRPQELVKKLEAFTATLKDKRPRMDMIGNLQTNKINQVLGRAELIHSISSLHLTEAVSKRAAQREIKQKILLEVNVSGEESKSGFSPLELRSEYESVLELEGVEVLGLMTMAPAGDLMRAQQAFSGLRELRDELERAFGHALPELSCGMSDDFVQAIAEGSTIVRLGRVVFDPEHTLASS